MGRMKGARKKKRAEQWTHTNNNRVKQLRERIGDENYGSRPTRFLPRIVLRHNLTKGSDRFKVPKGTEHRIVKIGEHTAFTIRKGEFERAVKLGALPQGSTWVKGVCILPSTHTIKG